MDASGKIKADCVWVNYKSVNNCLRRSFSFLFNKLILSTKDLHLFSLSFRVLVFICTHDIEKYR